MPDDGITRRSRSLREVGSLCPADEGPSGDSPCGNGTRPGGFFNYCLHHISFLSIVTTLVSVQIFVLDLLEKENRFPFVALGRQRESGNNGWIVLISYSKSVMLVAGISNLENANIFLPRSFREAPM